MLNFRRQIETASLNKVALSFAGLMAFSLWAFRDGGPWLSAIEAGGGLLPEMQPGYPPVEPLRTLLAFDGAVGDYLVWQMFDIPYIVLNVLFAASAIALGLARFGWGSGLARYLLALPVIYAVMEMIENTLLSLFAIGTLAPSEPVVLAQQTATTIKLTSGTVSFLLGVISIVAVIISMIASRMKKSS